MSREAIFNALASDSVLNGFGITEDSIFHNYSIEERPIQAGPWLNLRWGSQDRPPFEEVKAAELLDIWVNWPMELTNDFTKLIKILDQIDNILGDLRDAAGSDGYTVSFVRILGRSSDMNDPGFNTIAKTGSYEVYSRKDEV